MIVYTFRTFPYIDELKGIFGDVFVFSALKDDLVDFKKLIESQHDDVLGVALAQGPTRQEPVAINRFHRGRVSLLGKETLPLTLMSDIPLALAPTHTFCNWTMYKIQEHVNELGSPCRVGFIHINKDDLNLLGTL